MSITIESLEKKHIQQICGLIKGYRAETAKEFSEEDYQKVLDQLEFMGSLSRTGGEALSRVFVAAEGESVVGYIGVHMIPFPLMAGRELYISDLLVSPDYRGRGCGSLLLAHAEQFAQAQSCKRLMLNNLKEMPSYARGFYAAHGFTERENAANFVKKLLVGDGQ
ncbi:GNAT family N-acetyltransferase [Spirochaeta lutea]|uniref:GNAT family N-acetyltransferase n=1 Tax=Spirochaeta lutea TaxID=1480694 RepID=UPI00068BB612|nr:GNAT family N-acetyltransferase [Spirochaeta lutea]